MNILHKECEECQGEGQREYRSDCSLPASNCCGGCSEISKCLDCDGTGELEIKLSHDRFLESFDAIREYAIKTGFIKEGDDYYNELSISDQEIVDLFRKENDVVI